MAVKKAKLAAIGFSCMDVYDKLNKSYPTGNGVDWGVHLARLGMDVSVVSVTGNDEYGWIMREMLRGEKIDISHLHEMEGETCQMKMDLIGGVDRVHLEEIEGVMRDFALSEEDKEFIKEHDFLHTDLFGNCLQDLRELHEAGVKVVMDFSTFSDDPEFNTDENYRNDGKEFYRCGIIPVKTVNTVGAGDSYIAGFTYGVIQGWTIPECQQFGARLSASVVTKFEPY